MQHYRPTAGTILLATLLAASCGYAQTEAADAEASVAVATEKGVPGGVVVKTVTVEAKVIEIDHEARTATLQTPSGATMPIKVGPEAINFGQVQAGDVVKALVTEQLVIHMAEEVSAASDGATAVVALAPEGAMPGGVVSETVQATATVTAIDPAARTATLQFEDGSSKTVSVREDIDLGQHKTGEKVVFQMTQMIALSVEKQ